MPNLIKELILNRGWAGTTLSRSETAERLNVLIEQHVRLNYQYHAVIESYDDDRVVGVLDRLQKTARMDVGKLSETVLSCGGTPYSGTDLDVEDFLSDDADRQLLEHLTEAETDFNRALEQELDEVEHQMRTRGVLEAVKSNSSDRLEALSALRRRVDENIV